MKAKNVLICLFIPLFFLCSCENDDANSVSKRTVLVYFAADNNLAGYAQTCLNQIVNGAAGNNLNGGNLLVYMDYGNGTPQLLQIKRGKGDIVEKLIIKDYEEHNSASKEVMQSVMDDVFLSGKFKAESYGLILWSHGTAWLPSDFTNYLRSFGVDKNDHMEINTLKETLSKYKFDFIVFDACYMASLEVAYALKDIADYILASPTEILAESMPYLDMVKILFSNDPLETALQKCGQAFYDYYNAKSGIERSASVSLVKTAALQELASVCREILSGRQGDVFNLPVSGLQRLDHLRQGIHFLYDFDDFIKQMASASQYAAFKQRLSESILYKETTDIAYYGYNWTVLTIDKSRFCGVSVYVPQENLTQMNNWYKDMDWYKAVY